MNYTGSPYSDPAVDVYGNESSLSSALPVSQEKLGAFNIMGM